MFERGAVVDLDGFIVFVSAEIMCQHALESAHALTMGLAELIRYD